MDVFLFLSQPITVVSLVVSLMATIVLKLNHVRRRNTPPGNPGWPILGESTDFAASLKEGRPEKFIHERMKRHSPDVFKTSIMGQNVAVLCGPQGNKHVFSKEDELFTKWLPRTVTAGLFDPSEADNTVEEVRSRLEAMSGFLKPDALRKYIRVMDSVVRNCLNDDKMWCPDPNSAVKVLPMVKKLAVTLSSALFFGITDPGQVSIMGEQMDRLMSGFFSLPVNLPGTAYRRSLKIAKNTRDMIVEIARRERGRVRDEGLCMLSHLLSARDGEGKYLYDESKIAGLMFGVLVASHDNMISLMTNIVFYLADHPDVYARALTEQIEIQKQQRVRPEKPVLSWEDTRKMKYCRNVINEVLRLSPPLGNIRETLREFTFGGFTIPKGWKVFWSSLSTHKDPKYFDDPERFDPCRFEGKGAEPFTFTPFGGGPHVCPGREYARQVTLVFMHYLLIGFKWEKLIPNEKIVFSPIAFPQYGLPIKLSLRNKQDDDI